MFEVTNYNVEFDDNGYSWIATDEDGRCYIYKSKPFINKDGWKPQVYLFCCKLVAYTEFKGDWKKSLMHLKNITTQQYLNGEFENER